VSPQAQLPAEPYSFKEIRVLLQSLTAAEKTALMKVAAVYARKTRYGDRDLIQEAYLRLLDGKRGWPRTVATVPFLCGVMRSIAWDWRAESHHEDIDVDSIGSEHHAAAAKLDAQKLIEMFGDDPIAQKILAAMMEGARGEELRQVSELDETEYESKRRKIRRRLEKAWS
jgi:hypothetical protein